MATNYRQVYAIEKKNKDRLLKVNPKLNDKSGIYFLEQQQRLYKNMPDLWKEF